MVRKVVTALFSGRQEAEEAFRELREVGLQTCKPAPRG
jgi:hypothetical protein